MNLAFLTEYVNVITLGICLCVGYVIKTSITIIPNKYIPLIMLVLGTVISVLSKLDKISASVILQGMVSGLASTGLYEAFRNIINKESE